MSCVRGKRSWKMKPLYVLMVRGESLAQTLDFSATTEDEEQGKAWLRKEKSLCPEDDLFLAKITVEEVK
jgi:hypothetical protein